MLFYDVFLPTQKAAGAWGDCVNPYVLLFAAPHCVPVRYATVLLAS